MKEVTKEMIEQFKIKKLKYDFMGYTFQRVTDLSFHHLVVAKKDCAALGLGNGYLTWNGAILKQATSHDYLHLIERIDRDLFLEITNEMIDENWKGHLDLENLKRIRQILLYFEREHQDDTDRRGKRLIKTEFIKDRIHL